MPSTKEIVGDTWNDLLRSLSDKERDVVERVYAKLDEIHENHRLQGNPRSLAVGGIGAYV